MHAGAVGALGSHLRGCYRGRGRAQTRAAAPQVSRGGPVKEALITLIPQAGLLAAAHRGRGALPVKGARETERGLQAVQSDGHAQMAAVAREIQLLGLRQCHWLRRQGLRDGCHACESGAGSRLSSRWSRIGACEPRGRMKHSMLHALSAPWHLQRRTGSRSGLSGHRAGRRLSVEREAEYELRAHQRPPPRLGHGIAAAPPCCCWRKGRVPQFQ